MPRKKTFTIEFALDKAMELFWNRGYQRTSMREIAAHLGLSRSSIYATFGDKHRLFIETLRRYGSTCRVPGLSELRTGGSGRSGLLKIFELAISGAGDSDDRPDCLIINSAMELMHTDPEVTEVMKRAFLDMETSFRDAIDRGKSVGEISAGVDTVQAGRSLLALYLGLSVLGRSGAGKPVLRAVVDQVEDLLPQP